MMSAEDRAEIAKELPTVSYTHPGGSDRPEGFEEQFEFKDETLYVPQVFLERSGTDFDIKGSFTVAPNSGSK